MERSWEKIKGKPRDEDTMRRQKVTGWGDRLRVSFHQTVLFPECRRWGWCLCVSIKQRILCLLLRAHFVKSFYPVKLDVQVTVTSPFASLPLPCSCGALSIILLELPLLLYLRVTKLDDPSSNSTGLVLCIYFGEFSWNYGETQLQAQDRKRQTG